MAYGWVSTYALCSERLRLAAPPDRFAVVEPSFPPPPPSRCVNINKYAHNAYYNIIDAY